MLWLCVETVYSLAYGVNVKLAIVNLNMTTCKLEIQKLLLQPPVPTCSNSSATEKKNRSAGSGAEYRDYPKLAVPMGWRCLSKVWWKTKAVHF